MSEPAGRDDDCPLPAGVQRRNLCCFAAFWGIYYLAAPVSYVGLTHANLLKELGNSDTVSNLPSAVYLWLVWVPVLAAWLFPHPAHLKPLGLISVGALVAVTAAVAVTLGVGASGVVVSAVVIAHAAVFGAANGVLLTALWDAVKRGVSTSRRGAALGAAFGIGPLFACVGALLQDAAFDGKLLGGRSFGLSFPDNYLAMFAAVAPLLLLLAGVLGVFTLPGDDPPNLRSPATQAVNPGDERITATGSGAIQPQSDGLSATGAISTTHPPITSAPMPDSGSPLSEVALGIRQFLASRAVWMAVLIYVVVYSGGNAIFANVSLHAKDVLGEQADTLGVQSFLRFGCKAVAGALLGWLLATASPRATLLATTSVLLAGMGWALNSTGWWFMATFGLLGAGELFGAYFPNYVTTASPKRFVRVNMAYLSVLSALIGFSSLAFGAISDRFGRIASFYVAAGLLVVALVLIELLLPADPTPREGVDSCQRD